jgi:hypothetical protein
VESREKFIANKSKNLEACSPEKLLVIKTIRKSCVYTVKKKGIF